MLKKIISVFMVTALFISCLSVSFATERSETIHSIESKDTSLVRVIDDPEELCKWATDDVPGDITKSYKLEKIEIFQYNTSELKYEDLISTTHINNSTPFEPMALLYEIRNVRHSPNQFYYVNKYDSDWFYGPCDISETYSKEAETKHDISTTIGKETVNASIGYSFSQKYIVSKTFSTKVAENKVLNVKVHVNYTSALFDIHNKYNGQLIESDAWVAKPIGLIFLQYTYSK